MYLKKQVESRNNKEEKIRTLILPVHIAANTEETGAPKDERANTMGEKKKS